MANKLLDDVGLALVVQDYTNKIAGAITSVYKPGGSVEFANLPAPSASNLGYVYNVTDTFTTTSSFVEGSGKVISTPGVNVVVVDVGDAQTPEYKFDILLGDPTNYFLKSDVMSTTEVNNILNPPSGGGE